MFCPPEILSIIASYLPTSSIPEFRRTNKGFAVAGLPYLVPSLSIKLLPESFNKFTEFSQHPTLSRYVTEIVLIKDIVRDCRTIAEWQEDIYRSRPWPKAPKDDDPPELHAAYETSLERTWGSPNDYRFSNDDAHIGWRCQRDVRAQQLVLMRSGLPELLQCLTAALPRFPRLRSVKLAGCVDGHDSLGHQSLALVHQQRYRYSESLSAEGLLVGADQLRTFMLCVNQHLATKIEHLSACELHAAFFDLQIGGFQSLCNASCSLTSLDIDFSFTSNHVYGDWFGRNYTEYKSSFERGGIKLFLKALPKLRDLRLCFGTIGGLKDCLKFKHILGGVKLASLQDLDIANIRTRSKEFVQFFSDHTMCIKRIRLRDMCLKDEEPLISWSDVFEAMRCEMKLEAVGLSGNFETLLPSSQIDTFKSIPQHPDITISKLLTGYLLEKDWGEIFRGRLFDKPRC